MQREKFESSLEIALKVKKKYKRFLIKIN
jgi:hypothetical protein